MFNHFIGDSLALDVLAKLGAALVCGAAIGTERLLSHKAAGMRTYALVSIGAAFFVIVGELLMARYVVAGIAVNDPLQIPSMIISGIGFMGAGLIIFRDTSITGLTTASGLWVAAGIGMACGAGFFVPACLATLLTLFVFIVLYPFEQDIKKLSANHKEDYSEDMKA